VVVNRVRAVFLVSCVILWKKSLCATVLDNNREDQLSLLCNTLIDLINHLKFSTKIQKPVEKYHLGVEYCVT